MPDSTIWVATCAPDDLLVLNETRVIPARLFARKLPGGGKAEILLLHRQDESTWEASGRGQGIAGREKIAAAEQGGGTTCDCTREVAAPWMVPGDWCVLMNRWRHTWQKLGHVPLPPYIHASVGRSRTIPDRVCSPGRLRGGTDCRAALYHMHLIEALKTQGVRFARVTLHVGLDTFAPVTEDDPTQHQIHTEWCEVTPETAAQIREAQQARWTGDRCWYNQCPYTRDGSGRWGYPAGDWTNQFVHLAGISLSGCTGDDHQFSPAALDADHAGQCFCGS